MYRAIFTILIVGLLTPVNADASSEPLPKGSASEILWKNSSHFHSDFDKGVNGDCVSLLSRLEKEIQDPNEDREYAAHVVYGELYDRAICVPFDPDKAFDHFKQAADMGGPTYYAQVGWKYFHGHGIEKSDAKAHDAFKLLLIRNATWKQPTNEQHFHEILRDRGMPDILAAGVGWFTKMTKTDESAVSLALSLIDGSGRYYDDTALPIDKLAAMYALNQLSSDNRKARYHLGFEMLKGTFGEPLKREGEMHLIRSAKCGYVPAMLKLAHLSQTGEFGARQNNKDAYGWYLMAQRNGASVKTELEEAKKNAGSFAELTVPNDKKFMISCH
ncbi:SEL1-like repeat protein [Terasakiella sp. SH-1]|uniref:tetratricopeptide repeat protein n=1 Tax=Terasakiella sp. SH-1 TaxID=2560057 RepID=UPI00107444C6|nr:SEL1-like repeat protein [Terasakiella sp. SH-1]